MKITVLRNKQTDDGYLSNLSLDANPFTCFTVENKADAISVGTYPVVYQYSPEFNRSMPHIIVPGRTFIMFHWANYPKQLLGCIALGDQEEPDAVDDSIVTFNKFDKIISGLDGVTVEIKEVFNVQSPTGGS